MDERADDGRGGRTGPMGETTMPTHDTPNGKATDDVGCPWVRRPDRAWSYEWASDHAPAPLTRDARTVLLAVLIANAVRAES